MTATTSPGIGFRQDWVSLDSPASNTRSSRYAIKAELGENLTFDDLRVFERLHVAGVPDDFVDACAADFDGSANIQAAKQELRLIVAAASARSIDESEKEEIVYGRSVSRTRTEEKKMYPHLRTIFEFIEEHTPSQRQYQRQLVPTKSSVLQTEGNTWGFPQASPDFILLDQPSSHDPALNSTPAHLWRHRSAFAEIRPATTQGPKSSDPSTVNPIVAQCADYARLHLSARPFHLFSVGLLIFGSQFCAGIFDRGGVQFSPIFDMWEDTHTFIRLIRRLTSHLSPVELGQDPTVRILQNRDFLNHNGTAKALVEQAGQFPTYEISMGGAADTRRWYTLGLPIWTSVSLLGRGTQVWRVCEASDPARVLVLKNAWRTSERKSESEIYKLIRGTHPGVACFDCGSDVHFPGSDGSVINVDSLRGFSASNDPESPILHRLVTSPLGRPLWEYSSEVELLKGLRAALEGHRFLSEQGILHRDISAGNILLSAGHQVEEGHEGFLTDIEFAHIVDPPFDTQQTTMTPVAPVRNLAGQLTAPAVRTHIRFGTQSAKRGAVMTGTAQFTATDILDAIRLRKPIIHQVFHDIESFIWVLCYTLLRRSVLESKGLTEDLRDALHQFFHIHFGRMDLARVALSRHAFAPLRISEDLPWLLKEPVQVLLKKLHVHLWRCRSPVEPIPLTYGMMFAAIDQAVEELRSM